MISRWIKGLEKDRINDIKSEFKTSSILRERMIEILDEEINIAYKKLENLEVYRIFHRQEYIADLFGSIKTLRSIKELILEKDNA